MLGELEAISQLRQTPETLTGEKLAARPEEWRREGDTHTKNFATPRPQGRREGDGDLSTETVVVSVFRPTVKNVFQLKSVCPSLRSSISLCGQSQAVVSGPCDGSRKSFKSRQILRPSRKS